MRNQVKKKILTISCKWKVESLLLNDFIHAHT